MQRILFVATMILALTLAAFAQPDPAAGGGGNQPGGRRGQGGAGGPGGGPGGGNRGGMNQANLALEILPAGVFVLNNGVLAKFDTDTLKLAGTLELLGPLPAQPPMRQNPTEQERQAMRAWFAERMQRAAEPAILQQDNRLYIVLGTKYFCVNPENMQIDVKSDLGAGNEANPQLAMMAKPQLKLADGVLYAVLGQELLSVDPATGKVAARAPMPKELFPALAPNFGGGGNNAAGGNAGGGNRGNRGGGNRGGRGGGNAQ